MINYCTVNIEKLQNFKLRNRNDNDEGDDIETYMVGVYDQDDNYLIYEFEDSSSYMNFLDMLDDNDIDYDIIDDEDIDDD